MMGFGQGMMSLSWIGGLVAIALVWGGVWMLLSVIGAAPRRGTEQSSEPPLLLPSVDTWQQPDFTPPATASEVESDVDVVRHGDEHR